MRIGSWCVVVFGSLISCTKPNPVVCCTSPSDCNSIGVMGETERPCTEGFVCLNHECSTAPDAATSTSCTGEADCSAPTPHCSSGGRCVECITSDQCPAEKPVCEQTAGACVACVRDDDCASSVCDSEIGACVSEADVLYVSPSGSSVSTCTRSQPCTLPRAVALADAARDDIKMVAGAYSGGVDIAKRVKIHGTGATFNVGASVVGFNVVDGGDLQVNGLDVVNLGTSNTFDCRGANPTPVLTLRDVSIDAARVAVVAYGCTASILRTRIHARGNTAATILAAPTSNVTIDRTYVEGGNGIQAEGSGSVVRVTNSVIAKTLGPDGAFYGSNTFGAGAGAMFVSFSTVIASHVPCATSGAPKCAGGTASGSCIDNTIVVADSGDAIRGQCVVNYSLATPQSASLVGSNNIANTSPMLKDEAGGDYHLVSGSPAVDAADLAATNAFDYEGTPRPQGTRSDIGAFELKP